MSQLGLNAEEEKGHFHESYFEHPCVVGTEKDVLKTDIRGVGWFVALRRWWYGLFLLWYGDERCRIYYTSSNALRLERARHFRRYRGRIHPLSKFSNIWAVLILIVSIANRVTFHHNTSVMYGRLEPVSHLLGVTFEVIMLVDLVVNFKSGYLDTESRRVVLSSKKCLVHYCSTKLFIHIASAIPLQGIMLIRYKLQPCLLCNANKFVCCLKFLSIFSLIRVYEITRYWTRNKSSFNLTYFFKLVRILVLAGLTLLQFLNITDAVNVWMIAETNNIVPNSFLFKIMEVKKYMPEDTWLSFFNSVQFSIVCKSLFLFGYGDYGVQNQIYHVDAIQSLVGFIIANLFRIWAFVEWYTVINRQKTVEDHKVVHKDMTMNFMRTRQVSDQFSSKVEDYYDFIIARTVVMEKLNELYQLLPTCIIREIKISSYYRYVRRIPYFADWPSEVVEDLVILLKEEVYLQEDVVAPKWSQGDGLMILHVGMLAVYTADMKEVGHLIDGDYFGELSLVTDREVRTSEVIAITPCKILILYKKAFRRFMRKHDKMFFELREILRQKFHTEFTKSSVIHSFDHTKNTTFKPLPPPQPQTPPPTPSPTITSQETQKDQMQSVLRAIKNIPKNLQRKLSPVTQETEIRTSLNREPKGKIQEELLSINNHDMADYEWATTNRGLLKLRGSTGIRRPSTQMSWYNEQTSSRRTKPETTGTSQNIVNVSESIETNLPVENLNTYHEGGRITDGSRVSEVMKNLHERRKSSEDIIRYAPTQPRRYSPGDLQQRFSTEEDILLSPGDSSRKPPEDVPPDLDNMTLFPPEKSRRLSPVVSNRFRQDDSRFNLPTEPVRSPDLQGTGTSQSTITPRIRRQMQQASLPKLPHYRDRRPQ